MNSSIDVSIVIVSWNTKRLLAECIESIHAGPPEGNFEIYIVDNASTDGTAQMLAEHYPLTHLIVNPENVGFASANNQAIDQCQGRYIILLNPDTKVLPGTFQTLIEYMDQHPRAGANGPMLLNPDGTLQTSCYPIPTLSKELWRLLHMDKLAHYGTYDVHSWDATRPREVEVIQGACLVLRKEALDQVGILDGDYFMYTEEVDLCDRLLTAGWQIVWIPRAQVIHYGGQSTQQVATEMFLRLYESKLLFFRKRRGVLAANGYKLILLIITSLRLIMSPLALLSTPVQRRRHLQIASNYWKMLRALPGM